MKNPFFIVFISLAIVDMIYSQDIASADSIKPGLMLKEITITSQRFNKKLDEVIPPFELVTQEKISQSPGITIADILKNEAGLTISRDGIWGTNVSIRGISRSGIVTFIDGNRIETATDLAAGLSLINPELIERIEVIKGSSSLLYGTGAVGGVINITTKKSEYSDAPFIRGSVYSKYYSVNKSGDGGLFLAAGASTWRANVFANMRSADNTNTPRGEIPNSQYRDRSFAADLAFKPKDGQELVFNYQKFSGNDIGIPGGSSSFPANAIVKYSDIDREMFSSEYKIKNMIKNMNLFSVKYFSQNIDRYVDNIPFQVQTTASKIVKVLKITPNARHYTHGLQMQTDWQFTDDNYFIAGLDIWKRTLDSKREKYQEIDVLNSAGQVANIVHKTIGERPIPESDFRNIGGYINDEHRFLDGRFIINAGARIDGIKVTNKSTFNPVYTITNGNIYYTTGFDSISWKAGEVNDVSWCGSFGALYFVNDKTEIILNVSRSFRSPSLEERYQYIDQGGGVIRVGNPNLKPEDGVFSDIGVKYWGDDINLSANAFGNFLKSLIIEEPGTYQGKPALVKINSGKARLYGFDLSAEYFPDKNIALYCVAGYVRGRDTENNSDLPQMPPLNGMAGVKYSFCKLIKAEFSSVVFAAQNKIAAGEVSTPGYAYYNFYISSFPVKYGRCGLIINAGIENIFNRAYRNHLATNRGLVTIEPGRNVFIKLQLDW